MQVRRPELSPRFFSWAWVALVCGLTLFCYWPVLGGAMLWDDPAHVTRPDLRSWEGLGRIWFELRATQQYYPVLHTAFWIEHRLWGDATPGYHLVNIALHAASCCLLAVLLGRLWSVPAAGLVVRSPQERIPPAGTAWFVALLFAVHPVCVESVAWISEQKNTLSLFFYLLAALVYLDFAERRRRGSYLLASILFLLALGTKTTTATLPAALLVVVWWKHGRLGWPRDVRPLLPWFVGAVSAGLFTAWVERRVIGAEGVPYDLSAIERLLLAGRIIWFYLGKLLWPADLAFFYARWDVSSVASGWIGYLVAAVLVTLALWTVRKKTRGPLAGWLLFVGSLLPALGFFNVFPFIFSYVADHFQYLASIGILATVTGVVALALRRAAPPVRALGTISAAITIVVLALLSHRQSGWYRDNETLFRATIARTPDSWMAHHILAVALAKSPGREAESIPHYEAALRLNPQHPDAHLGLGIELAKSPDRRPDALAHYRRAVELRPNYVEAHQNLAVELAKFPDRVADALAHFETALRLKPDLAEAHLGRGDLLARMGNRSGEARGHYEEALRLKPDYAEAHHRLGFELLKLPGQGANALRHLETAVRLKPGDAEAHYNLANALATLPERRAGSVPHYQEALRLTPGVAVLHYNFANVLVTLPGRVADALPHYEAAVRLQPDFAEAHANLANTLAALPGRLPEALPHYETALRLNPALGWVHQNLAFHLAQIPGRHSEAISHAEEAVRLQPQDVEAHNSLAILHAQLGQPEKARSHWARALQIDPNYVEARENLRRLEQMMQR